MKLPQLLKPRQVAPPPPKELGEYTLPQWDCLADAEHGYAESQEQFVREKAAILEQALKEFNIDAHVVEIDTGPVITMYELALAPGVKVGQISALSNDIQRALKAETIRIVAPMNFVRQVCRTSIIGRAPSSAGVRSDPEKSVQVTVAN